MKYWYLRLVVISIFTLLPSSLQTADQDANISIADFNIILDETNSHRLWKEAFFSPDGYYLITHSALMTRRTQYGANESLRSERHLWKLSPELSRRRMLQWETNSHLWETSDDFGSPPMAFSHDGQSLAIRSDELLNIYEIPGFNLSHTLDLVPRSTLPSTGYASDKIVGLYNPELIGYPIWSPDDSLIAFMIDEGLKVWFIEEGKAVVHPVPNVAIARAMETGWFIDNIGNSSVFEVCQFDVTVCDVYDTGHSRAFSIVSPNGEYVVTRGVTTERIAQPEPQLWILSEDRQYELHHTLSNMGFPRSISPNGDYVMASGVAGGTAIWELVDTRLLLTIPYLFPHVAWLPDSKHVIAVNRDDLVVEIYDIERNELIEHSDLTTLPGFENSREWIDLESFRIADVSADGRKVLINFGWALVILTLEYE